MAYNSPSKFCRLIAGSALIFVAAIVNTAEKDFEASLRS